MVTSHLDSNNKQLNEWMKRFPKHTTGRRLAEIGWLIKSNVGLKIAVTDTGGWDTHVYQGSENGKFSDRMTELTESIDSLRENLEKDWGRIVLLTVTEFGRTAAENGTRGTDHGHGSVMMAMGGSIKGGKVYGKWTSLKNDQLYEGRDIPVTTDYRLVFKEILQKHLRTPNLDKVFPHFTENKDLNLLA